MLIAVFYQTDCLSTTLFFCENKNCKGLGRFITSFFRLKQSFLFTCSTPRPLKAWWEPPETEWADIPPQGYIN